MAVIIGLDGGGTKTKGCIGTSKEEILGVANSGGINRYAYSEEEIIKHINEVVEALLIDSKLKREDVDMLVVATAGADTSEDEKELKDLLIKAGINMPILIKNDASCFMEANFEGQSGIVTIAGTGSISYGQANGKQYRFGGHGHLIGDEGSGYWIAIQGLNYAFRQYDNGSIHPIMQSFLDYKGFDDPMALRKWIYSDLNKSEIADLSVCLSLAAEGGDYEALKILDEAGNELIKVTMALYKKMREQGAFPEYFAYTGSVLKNVVYIYRKVEQEIRSRTAMKVISGSLDPEVCALIEGLKYIENKEG